MPTPKQKKVVEKLLENRGMSVGQAMREAGYSEGSIKNPQQLTRTKTWHDLMEQYLPDRKLAQAHKKLLDAKQIDHMVFPLATPEESITDLVKSVGGTVRRFQHGETAIHCWFWAPNIAAQTKAIELAYKIKGHVNGDAPPVLPPPTGSTINIFMGAELAGKFANWFEQETKQGLAEGGQ